MGMTSSHDENIPSQNLYRDEKTIRKDFVFLTLQNYANFAFLANFF